MFKMDKLSIRKVFPQPAINTMQLLNAIFLFIPLASGEWDRLVVKAENEM